MTGVDDSGNRRVRRRQLTPEYLRRMFGADQIDQIALAGLAGAVLLAHFAWRLMVRTGAVLLDVNPSPELTAEIRRRMEAGGERLLDLHLWRLGPGHHAAIVVVESQDAQPAEIYRARLAGLPGLSHVTVETRQAR